jgi:hypothetical protein
MSQQAYALRAKILEVDVWARRDSSRRVIEVHLEVSFATMGEPPAPTFRSPLGGIRGSPCDSWGAEIAVPAELGVAGEMASSDGGGDVWALGSEDE